jgi:hypothetical protein
MADTSDYSCSDCGWAGNEKELVFVPLQNKSLELSQDTAVTVVREVSQNFLLLLAKHAAPHIGLAMVDSGLVSSSDVSLLAHLIKSACKAAHTSTLLEVEKISKAHKDREKYVS